MHTKVARGGMAVLALLTLGRSSVRDPAVRDASQPGPSVTPARSQGCADLPDAAALKKLLQDAPSQNGDAGGLNHGKAMWGALVDRNGALCALAVSTEDAPATWPGSRAIAMAKAFTANGSAPIPRRCRPRGSTPSPSQVTRYGESPTGIRSARAVSRRPTT